jgi:hypothetical protein
MMVETAASLAGPWLLKLVIDNAVGRHAAPEWVVGVLGPAVVAHLPARAAAAAVGMVLLAVLLVHRQLLHQERGAVGRQCGRECPGRGRDRIYRFIAEASHGLFVQNERFQDMVIIERLFLGLDVKSRDFRQSAE